MRCIILMHMKNEVKFGIFKFHMNELSVIWHSSYPVKMLLFNSLPFSNNLPKNPDSEMSTTNNSLNFNIH